MCMFCVFLWGSPTRKSNALERSSAGRKSSPQRARLPAVTRPPAFARCSSSLAAKAPIGHVLIWCHSPAFALRLPQTVTCVLLVWRVVADRGLARHVLVCTVASGLHGRPRLVQEVAADEGGCCCRKGHSLPPRVIVHGLAG